MHRENAEAAIINYLAEEPLSPESIDVAKREYREAVIKELESKESQSTKPDVLCAEEAKLREMLKAGILSSDVAQAALDAIANKRRKFTSIVRMSPAAALQSFDLGAERYSAAVRNLGEHVALSEHSAEERTLMRELLGGHGTVFRRNGALGRDSTLPDCSMWQNALINQ